MPTLILLFVVLLVTGCATDLPQAIGERPPQDLSLAQARAAGQAALGRYVRWGGTVAGVENRAAETWVEIVERRLYRGGRPQQSDASGGRFLARVDYFLDPAVYAAGREVTVAGSVDAFVTRPIGDYPYGYVVLKAEAIYLWPPLPERDPIDYPYWYDPWYPWDHPFRYPYPR